MEINAGHASFQANPVRLVLTIPKTDIRARVQLNVRDAFETGELRAVRVNPDGNPSHFRIIDGRQILLTTTFDF